MSEGKRIEGQMFLRGSIGWVVAVIVLLLGAGGTLVVGYTLNRWIAMVSAAGVQGATGPAPGPFPARPGVTVVTPGVPLNVAGIPGASNRAVSPLAVPWPVPVGSTFREHWEAQRFSTGTLHGFFQEPGPPPNWPLSTAISIPVPGERVFVLAVHIPRDTSPADATTGQIWVCRLALAPSGDIIPVESTVRRRAALDAHKLKHIWGNGLPPALVKDLIDGANGSGPFAATDPGPYGPLLPIDGYFPDPEAEPAESAKSPG